MSYIARLAGWALPAFAAWYLSAAVLWVPLVAWPGATAVEGSLREIGIELVQSGPREWTLRSTRLFRSTSERPNNSYAPDLRLGEPTAQVLGSLAPLTLGLPLLWALLLGASRAPVRDLLLGTALLLPLIMLALGLFFFETALHMLRDGGALLRVLTPQGFVQQPPAPASWLLDVLRVARRVSAVAATGAGPALIAAALNRPALRAWYLGRALARHPTNP